MPKPSRWFILEPYLTGYSGHCAEYCFSIGKVALERGVPIVILGDAFHRLTHEDQKRYQVYRWFFTLRTLHPLIRIGRKLWRVFSYFRGGRKTDPFSFQGRLEKALQRFQVTPQDTFYLPTVYIEELQAVLNAMSHFDGTKLPRFQIMLRRDPREPFVKQTVSSEGKRFDEVLNRLLQHPLAATHLQFFTDTELLTECYQELFPIRCTTLPIPFNVDRILKLKNHRSTESTQKVRISYLGEARTEKGFHLLPQAVQTTLQSKANLPPVEFCIQLGGAAVKKDPKIIEAVEELKKIEKLLTSPNTSSDTSRVVQIRWVGSGLSETEYYDWLLSSDLILLPYEANLYLGRSSGIFAEAMLAGIPTVVPDQTWMSEWSKKLGLGVVYGGEEDFSDKLVQAIQSLGDKKIGSQAALAWSKLHTPELLMDRLWI